MIKLSNIQKYLLVVLLLLAVTSCWSYMTFLNMEKQSDRIVLDAIPISNAANDLLPQLLNQESGLRGYLITGDNKFLEYYYKGQITLYDSLNEIVRYQARHPNMKHLIEDAALPQIRIVEKYFESQIDLVQSGNLRTAQLRVDDGKMVMDEFRKIDERIGREIDKIINESWERSNEAAKRAEQVILIGTITALLLGIAFIYSFTWQRNQEKLKYYSEYDGLTDLYNRRSFDQHLLKALSFSKKQHQPISLIMFDIDHFKKYNDAYGHLKGDRCLKAIASYLRSEVHPPFFAARYGGEEFSVILQGNSEIQAIEFAEKLRQGIEQLEIEHCGNSASPFVTISIGVALVNPDFSGTATDIIRSADTALYQAKHTGKNRAVLFGKPE